jgi:hypothetical protein
MAEQPVARGVVECASCPGRETGLRCGRCEKPICPNCLVMSPVGARCKDCAPMRRAPMYEVSAEHTLRAAGVAIGGGIGMGLIWGFIGAAFSMGFFLIMVGIALGYAFTRMMDWATRGKRGPTIIAFAIGGIVIAWGMQFVFVPAAIAQMQIIAAAIAAAVAYYNLR